MRTGTSKPQTHITDPEEQRRHTELASQTVWTLREKKKSNTALDELCIVKMHSDEKLRLSQWSTKKLTCQKYTLWGART